MYGSFRMARLTAVLLGLGASSLMAPVLESRASRGYSYKKPGRAKLKDRSYRVPGNKLLSKAKQGKLGLIR